MDQAKAVINLKEGTIQLEGPVEFVREYLNWFAQWGTEGMPEGTRSVPKPEAERGKRRTRRHRLGRQTGRSSLADAISSEVESGFFGERRPVREVVQRLAEKGAAYSTNSVRTGLKAFVESGVLTRSGAGKNTRYQQSAAKPAE